MSKPNHHTKKGFKNPYLTFQRPAADRWNVFKWNRKMRAIDQTRADFVVREKPNHSLINNPDNKPQVTWIGHSSILIQHKNINILTDPVLYDRVSPFLKLPLISIKRIIPSALSIKELPRIDVVVISHDHSDHLDKQTIKKLGNKPLWIVPLKLKQWLQGQGINNVVELDWWQEHSFKGATFTCTPAQHWSGRVPWVDPNESTVLWASWAIDIAGWKFWFGGDTGYNDIQFKEIGDRLGPFDAAAIPIGAYLPEWFQAHHVNPEQAVHIHNDIRSKWSFGIHWGTFILSIEAIDQPPQDLATAKKEAGLPDDVFITLGIGETKVL